MIVHASERVKRLFPHRAALCAALVAGLAGALAAGAATKFVTPLAGSQSFGLSVIEISTDAAAVDRVDFFVDGVLAGAARQPPYRIAFDFGTSQNARTISARVWTNGFKSSETASVVTSAMTVNDRIDVYLVEVPVRIRSSRVVKPADIRVAENGVQQEVRDVRRERPPAHFAFVVDRSLSMDGGKLEASLRAVQQQLVQLRPGDTASLVLFNHNVAKAVPIARGEDLSRNAVAASGGTSLRDALASTASAERTYAIVITDGGDRNSVLSDEDALRRISGTRTIVSALVMGSSHARFLDRATDNTGGRLMTTSAAAVDRDLAEVLADINSRYLVVYQSKGTKAGWRRVGVKAQGRNVHVLSGRKEYFAG